MPYNRRMAPNNRPLLLFKHNPKAAGGTILAILEEIKPRQLSKKKYDEQIGNGTIDSTLNDTTITNITYVRIREASNVNPTEQQHAFVISTIREPCSHFVSLWSFGSTGRGGIFERFNKSERTHTWTEAAYGKDAPDFSSDSDINRFRNVWLSSEYVGDLINRRFRDAYFDRKMTYPPPVDCWVYVEDFPETMISCLQQFERQGGSVNWTAPMLMELKTSLQKKKRRLQYAKNGLVNNQLSHHAKCEQYYDNETATMVELQQSLIYDLFGYDGCCKRTRSIVVYNQTDAILNVRHDRNMKQRDDRRRSNYSPFEDELKKQLLIFKNNGNEGSSIQEILREMKPIEIPRDYVMKNLDRTHINETFQNFQENESILPTDQRNGFVISHIREPCSTYLSVWKSGSQGIGDVFNYWLEIDKNWTEVAYGQDAPLFNSSSDVERFREEWYVKNQGIIANHFNKTYLRQKIVKPPVHCWVYHENFEATLLSCLQQFEDRGGFVQWNTSSLIAVVYSLRQREMNYKEVNAKKQERFQQCHNYFDDKTAAIVENGQDSFLYGMFGYDGCCKDSPLLTSNLTHPLNLDTILSKQSNYTKDQVVSFASKDHLSGLLEEEVVIKDYATKIDLIQSDDVMKILSQVKFLSQVIICVTVLLLLRMFGIKFR